MLINRPFPTPSSYVSHTRRLWLGSRPSLCSFFLSACVCNPLAVVLQTQEKRSREKGPFVGSCWPSARPPGRPASGARQKTTTAAQSQVKPLSVIPTRGAAYLDANIITRHAHSQWGRSKLRKDEPLFCFFFPSFTFLSASDLLFSPSFREILTHFSSLFNSTFCLSCARRGRRCRIFRRLASTVASFLFLFFRPVSFSPASFFELRLFFFLMCGRVHLKV